MTYQLAAHQKRILGMMKERGCLGIFAEAGTGKTMIALTYIYDGMISGQIDDALVVCPASLIPSWWLAIERMREFGYSDFDVELMKDTISISSYQMIWRGISVNGKRRYVLRESVDKDWDVIVVDESHRLGDPSSVQTKMMLKLATHTQHRFIMTGTPDSTRYIKLYGQIRFLDPWIWSSYKEFDQRYVWSKDIYRRPTRYDIDSLELLKKLYATVVRLRDCFDMPSATDIDMPIELGDPGAYDDMIHFRTDNYGIRADIAGIGVMKAMQICSGFYLDDNGIAHRVKCNKPDALMTIVEGTEDKVVVFAHYRESINTVCDMLKKAHVSYYRFDGTVKDPVWQDFQKDDTRVFVTQYQRGSEGIDLFASCRMVFYEPTTSAVLLEQAKARIMRKGQTVNCRYYHLYTQGTIEERIMKRVRSGVDVSRELLDKWALEERNRA